MNHVDLGLAGLVVSADAFPQATVSSDEKGVELSYSGVTISTIFTDTGGWEMRFSPANVLQGRVRVAWRLAYADVGGGVQYKGGVYQSQGSYAIWRMRHANDEAFLTLLRVLAETAFEIFEPRLVAEDIAEILMGIVPCGSWFLHEYTLRFCVDGDLLLWVSWDEVQGGDGLAHVHLGPCEAFGRYLDADCEPGEGFRGVMTLLDGRTFTGCKWRTEPCPDEDGCFICGFEFRAARSYLFEFIEGVARVAAAVPFLY